MDAETLLPSYFKFEIKRKARSLDYRSQEKTEINIAANGHHTIAGLSASGHD